MKKIIVIPARFASTRLPGKPLLDIGGMTMIERVYRQAEKAGLDEILVATDDERILEVCKTQDMNVIMTDAEHQSGTDRLAEVVKVKNYDSDDIIINVQGDEPLIPPSNIAQVADLLEANPDAVMATLSTPITELESFKNPNVVKVVSDATDKALYFSRAQIPFERAQEGDLSLCQRHIGIYAYRAGFLPEYASWPVAELEQRESLEQLRVLYQGKTIMVQEAREVPPEGVDTPEDLTQVRLLVDSLSRSI